MVSTQADMIISPLHSKFCVVCLRTGKFCRRRTAARQNADKSRHTGCSSSSLGDALNGFGCNGYDQCKQRFGDGYGQFVHMNPPFFLEFWQKKSRMDILSIRFLKIIYSCKVGLSVCVARAAAWGGGAFLQNFSKNFGAEVQSVSQCPPCLLYYSCVPGNTKTTNECERRGVVIVTNEVAKFRLMRCPVEL